LCIPVRTIALVGDIDRAAVIPYVREITTASMMRHDLLGTPDLDISNAAPCASRVLQLRAQAGRSRVIAMLPQGAMVGAYRILTRIGEGGMGAVYLAEHTLLRRRAAIKVLLPSLSTSEEDIQRFFIEARAVSMICDPGIVQIFDFGYHSDGGAFIVMELLDGESMTRRLRRIRRFAVIDSLRLAQQICTAVEAAHRKGIVHRDLKPGNLFLVADRAVAGGERVKVLDFGIAKLSGDDTGKPRTQQGRLMGTPAFMSPEQCRCSGDVDHHSDIYSVGCVLFAMVTGRPPFHGKPPGELLAAHLLELPPRASSVVADLPELVEQVIQRCLSKAPADRYPSMTALAEALGEAERALSGTVPGPAVLATPLPVRAGGVVARGGLITERDPTTLHAASGEFVAPPRRRGDPVQPGARRSRRLVGALLGVGLLAGTGALVVLRGDREAGAREAPPVLVVARPDVAAPPVPAPAIAVTPRREVPPEPARAELGGGSVGTSHVAGFELPLPSRPVSTAAGAPSPAAGRGPVRTQPGADRHPPIRPSAGDNHVRRIATPANIDPMVLDRGD
jgi:eukaryotic-like serine/threonine-protein kinase